jgi:uncharacterized protein YkwD
MLKPILTIAIGMIIISTTMIIAKSNYPPRTQITPEAIVTQTNNQRLKADLKPLQSDPTLIKSAAWKLTELCGTNQFSHDTKTMNWQDFFVNVDSSVTLLGENLAKGQTSTESVVKMWMQSPSHRENMLRSEFSKTGVATKECGGKWFTVQHFGG